MKRLLLLLFILIGTSTKAQILTTTFVDPCTKEVKLITVPLVGSTTVAVYNKTKTFTAADVTSGALSPDKAEDLGIKIQGAQSADEILNLIYGAQS